jgi:drug/metabolite transporter (DMT)-like permease
MSETGGPQKSPAYLRWFDALSPNGRGIFLVSAGSIMLVVMAAVSKYLGQHLPPFELVFFRAIIGFLFILPLFWRDPFEPLRSGRHWTHLSRGLLSWLGNSAMFWTITHMLLADAMALQFSRPLWTIPLALLFLPETVPMRRIIVALVGFAGIWMYTRPFTEGFDPNAVVGAFGGLCAALVMVTVKRLSATETTRIIMFWYSFYNVLFAIVPAWMVWVTPALSDMPLLILMGFLGIAGQSLITRGVHYGDTTLLAPLDYTRILYSSAIGYFLFGELPGLWSVAGMALIVFSSIYLVISEKRKK